MEFTISNQYLQATVSSLAAEVVSLKKNGKEFIWDRNNDDWHNCNPILFPIVGPLKNNSYTYNNKQFSLTQHGFLRRSQFNFIEVKKDSLILQFKQNDATKELESISFDKGICLNTNIKEGFLGLLANKLLKILIAKSYSPSS